MRPLLLTLLLTSSLGAQIVPAHFSLGKVAVDSNASYIADTSSYAGIGSNSIVDILAGGDSLVFFGTSRGLSLTPDLGNTFRSYVTTVVGQPEGGIAALSLNDSLLVIGALTDTVVRGESLRMGSGLAYSVDLGDEWTFVSQPQDPAGSAETITISWAGQSVEVLAITTPVQNVTWDLAYSLGTIWAASWSGGLRRYTIATDTWATVPLPRDSDVLFSCDTIPEAYVLNPSDPSDGGNHNHKGFSVMAYDSLVWFGSAGGLNKGIVDSTTGCISWTHYTFVNDNLSADWVVALYRQQRSSGDRIWASTGETDSSQTRGLSYTDDGGLIWKTTLLGKRVHNITSFNEIVYAATAAGLYKSPDGLNWARFKSARDALTGERIYADAATGVLLDSRDSSLWVGTPDGLGRTSDNGVTWVVERNFVSTATEGKERFYAYPNPFTPALDSFLAGSGHVRLQYHVASGETNRPARIAIFDFAGDPVNELTQRLHLATGDFSQAWDGRNSAGFPVANGVYYCRLKLGADEYWTKVVVIN